jgi:hypothetical protein
VRVGASRKRRVCMPEDGCDLQLGNALGIQQRGGGVAAIVQPN